MNEKIAYRIVCRFAEKNFSPPFESEFIKIEFNIDVGVNSLLLTRR